VAKIIFFPCGVVHVLSVKHVVHCHHVVIFGKNTRTDSPQLLHVSSGAQEKAKVNTECSDIGTGFTAYPEDAQMPLGVIFVKLALVDRSHTKPSLNGGDQRRALEESTGKAFNGGRKKVGVGDIVVQTNNSNVFLTGALLGLDQTSRSINANNKATSNSRIKSARVASLLDTEDFLHPSNNFVRRGIGRLVQVDNTVLKVFFEGSTERRVALSHRSVMASADEQFIVVLEQKWPFRSV
jgi:hypothetical protein